MGRKAKYSKELKLEIVKKLKQMGLSITQIVEATGLTQEEINKL